MTRMTEGVVRRPAYALHWMASTNLFVFSVLASGAMAFVEYNLIGTKLPLEPVFRLLLCYQLIFAATIARRSTHGFSTGVHLAVIGFFVSAFATVFMSAAQGASLGQALSAMYFMYNIGFCLLAFVLVPVTFAFNRVFKIFAFVAVAFGFLQVTSGDLLLPPQFRDQYGIVFDKFVNGQVRVLSFFASPPRFAELLAFLAVYLQYTLLASRRRRATSILLHVSMLAVVLFVLYHTYSRSGYILWAVASVAEIVIGRRMIVSGARGFVVLLSSLAAFATAVITITFGGLSTKGATTDATSLAARYGHWGDILGDYTSGGIMSLLFGTGKAAGFSRNSDEYFVVDNVALAIVYYGGILALVTLVFLGRRVFKLGLQACPKEEVSDWHPLLAYFVALFVEGMFVDNHNTIFITEFVILGILTRESYNSIYAGRRTIQGVNQSGLGSMAA